MDRLTSDRFNIHGVDINNARLWGCWVIALRMMAIGFGYGGFQFPWFVQVRVAVGLLRGVLNLKTILEICRILE